MKAGFTVVTLAQGNINTTGGISPWTHWAGKPVRQFLYSGSIKCRPQDIRERKTFGEQL